MENIKLYEVNADYIDYLSAYAPHLFQNKKPGQNNERKYIGIVFQINGLDYYLEQLKLSEQYAREAASDRRRLYQYMGILGGIGIVILIF